MFDDQSLSKPEPRVDFIADWAARIGVIKLFLIVVSVDELDAARHVVRLDNLEVCRDVAALADHMPHAWNGLHCRQVKGDVVERRSRMIASRHLLMIVRIQGREQSLQKNTIGMHRSLSLTLGRSAPTNWQGCIA